ncbi:MULTISPECIES: hypothetical protein [Achromobacter]|uniref:DUF551 domain-containing protein n=1 Tax=Achromobacter spanius TaxID=217203 RepID=A0ABY8GSH9_9BURK|nr:MULTISPECIES: hypothetical protein [Achromobacter]WAI83233.1 hypothetical protein N8Z00_27690 [Achromobacter spanius]WEX93319.1 hypothetical protein N3Z32_22290 [Achromobacter sp. SS2-2022]WFP07523.1 hypothetical protein P8T11_24960 [Achromobacter spanius]
MNSEWKPIASAPENEGRPLFCELCWGPEGDQSVGTGFRHNGKWYAAGLFYCLGQEKRYELREVEVQPTHWKPQSDLPDEESAAPTSHPIPTGATGEDGGDETQAILRWIMRTAESAKEDCGMDPETPAAVRNGKLASIASAAAQALGLTGGPSYRAPAAGDALPPLDDDLIEILGRPNFACAELATLLRAGGHSIKNKAEHEQAAVIHFLLGHYLKHGAAWHEHVGAAFEAIAQQSQRKEAT